LPCNFSMRLFDKGFGASMKILHEVSEDLLNRFVWRKRW
jgi:hypothetical protein